MTERSSSLATELDGICHDAMHIIVTLSKTLALYAPAEGAAIKADADALFQRWTAARAALAPAMCIGLDVEIDGGFNTAEYLTDGVDTLFVSLAARCLPDNDKPKYGRALPPSLAATPNIPHHLQTLEQLRAERDHWIRCINEAAGFPSAKAADNFRKACETWIARREKENGHG